MTAGPACLRSRGSWQHAAMTMNKKTLHLGTLRQWHWISSALCLAGMLLFGITGITLNHAGKIEARPDITTVEDTMPELLLMQLAQPADQLPDEPRRWLESALGQRLDWRALEWSADELYLGLPRPGGDGWLSLDLVTGELLYEVTNRGWIAYFNDLHKGRHTGALWSLFIDLFALACVVFSLTGLWLLVRQARRQPWTWPVTMGGLLIPVLLMILFIH